MKIYLDTCCLNRPFDDHIFLTTDDKLLKLTEKNKDQLRIVVRNPLNWLIEVL